MQHKNNTFEQQKISKSTEETLSIESQNIEKSVFPNIPHNYFTNNDEIIIGTRQSEFSLPNLGILRNISENKTIRLLDIGKSFNSENISNSYLLDEELQELQNVVRESNSSSSKFGSAISLFRNEHSELPTEKEFKQLAWELKNKNGIKISHALDKLAKTYGYSCFNAIKQNFKREYITMRLNLDYNRIMEIIEIFEDNSKHFSNIGNRKYIREETIKNEPELLKCCNDAFKLTTNAESNYSKFSDISLDELRDALLKVLDYKLKFLGTQTEFNIIKSITVEPASTPNDRDYLVLAFNIEYNEALMKECDRAILFANEVNYELINDNNGKTFEASVNMLYKRYKLRNGYHHETEKLDELSYKVEIVLENKIKVCYIGFFDKLRPLNIPCQSNSDRRNPITPI